MTTSLLADAFAHHVWATEQLIDACADLTEEQLATYALGTRGSIIETLRHICGSDTWYLAHLHTDRADVPDAEKQASPAQLREMITRNGQGWSELLATGVDPDVVIVERNETGEFHTAVGVWLSQAVHHGTDHRSQVCTALTSLGIEPPDIDVWAYARASGRETLKPAAS
jgi:uncharacterized damage-inducible protein DinB